MVISTFNPKYTPFILENLFKKAKKIVKKRFAKGRK